MFVLNDDSPQPKIPPESIVSVFQSINEPKVAAGEGVAEPTQAFVVMASEGDLFKAHILLYLTRSKKISIYSWDEGDFSRRKKKDVEGEALDFVEGMGFMMDNLNLEKLSMPEKSQTLDSLGVFALVDPKIGGEVSQVFERKRPKEEDELLDEILEDQDHVVTRIEPKTKTMPKPMPKQEESLSLKTEIKPMPKTPAASDDFDFGEAFELSDAEFQRDSVEMSEIEDVASFSGILEESEPPPPPIRPAAPPRVEAPAKVATQTKLAALETSSVRPTAAESSDLQALLRLMSSL
jgi:hypothetical protein